MRARYPGSGPGVPCQGPGRPATTDELLAQECQRHLDRRRRREKLIVTYGLGLFAAGLIIALISASPSHSRTLFKAQTLPYSCEQIQWAVAHFGRDKLITLGKKYGVVLTASQRQAAENCIIKSEGDHGSPQVSQTGRWRVDQASTQGLP